MPSEMTKGLPIGTEVIARCDYKSSATGHLTFSKGDILTIVGEDNYKVADNGTGDDSDWYLAQHSDGRKGLVPVANLRRRTEVKLNSTPWFHGKITRDEAEQLLQPPKVSTFNRS